MIGLIREVGDIGHRALHVKRHFILSDASRDRGVERTLVLKLMQLTKSIEHHAMALGRHTRRIVQVEDRVFVRSKLNSLVLRRQEAASP